MNGEGEERAIVRERVGGGGRRESGIYSKGEGRVWLSEIKGLYDNL